jgi:hypothetical protein
VSVSKTKGGTNINKSKDSDLKVQLDNQGRFSTESDPTPPEMMGVDDNMKDAHKLRNTESEKEDTRGSLIPKIIEDGIFREKE